MTRLEREKPTEQLKFDRLLMPRTTGRPDKHTRRKLRDRHRGDEASGLPLFERLLIGEISGSHRFRQMESAASVVWS